MGREIGEGEREGAEGGDRNREVGEGERGRQRVREGDRNRERGGGEREGDREIGEMEASHPLSTFSLTIKCSAADCIVMMSWLGALAPRYRHMFMCCEGKGELSYNG